LGKKKICQEVNNFMSTQYRLSEHFSWHMGWKTSLGRVIE
jgi:hypothetical protein